jgi:hypothetical protein
MLDPKEITRYGFHYVSIGRPPLSASKAPAAQHTTASPNIETVIHNIPA